MRAKRFRFTLMGAAGGDVRVERRGKSSPIAWRHVGAVNSIRSNTVEGHMAGPAVPWRWLEHVGNGVSQIDGCLRQNPAYRQAHKNMTPFRQFRKGAFF